jgi:putative restriction endonuclease
MADRNWTHEELVVAFNLYCKIPFGRIDHRNPQLIELAKAIGRSPSAVAWKLANFARLDPKLKERKISGASHGSRAEIAVWNEFADNWEKLSFESERLLQKLTGSRAAEPHVSAEFPKGLTRQSIIRARVNQGFFRAALLAAYEGRCCITGMSIPQLLTASHIVPWSVDVANRTNPSNGLCLISLHDRAFDCGLLTITPNLTVKISPKAKARAADNALQELLWKYDGAAVKAPPGLLRSRAFWSTTTSGYFSLRGLSVSNSWYAVYNSDSSARSRI